ncbi:MAG: VOC family protein [Thermoplasmata archaeon]
MEPTRTPKLAPYLAVSDARGLIRFMEKGIGGRLAFNHEDDEGRLVHAEVQIADSLVMVGETPSGRPMFPAMIHLYVPDADAAYRKALDAGATSVREPTDAPDDDRRGGVKDPWGNEWWFTRLPKSK